MHETNPFLSPQHVAEPVTEAIGDPTRPKPWSVLSVLATMVVVAILIPPLVATIMNVGLRATLKGQLSYDPLTMTGASLILPQVLMLGFWMGVGSGSLWMRAGTGLLLMGGLCGETAIMGHENWTDVLQLLFSAIAGAVFFDSILLAYRERSCRRQVLGNALLILFSIAVILLLEYSPLFWQGKMIALPWYVLVGPYVAIGISVAMGGIFLLLQKHGLGKRGWKLAVGGLLLTPLMLGIALLSTISNSEYSVLEFSLPWACLEIGTLVLFHATQRTLRSYGGSYVPLALVTSEFAET
ncbi:hypothetical protein [Blastopirellula marina]|uniref:Uncharacterized protein n=1 Tax=Blastopirellula marina TaxID=124 RepID=A0A2S8FMC0_9BACT|nr:hypothetical protein [Blastopirellula marina]PQO33004.1 hypothetical protein C5Y98_17870 [Blastopirellula marina]PTL43171.1 hypothetical protein C5Y97_17880 [Blastopirellula marina]